VQAIVQIALHGPGKLRVFDVARVNRRVVGVEPEAAIFKLDHQLHRPVVLARGEIEQCVFVTSQFGLYLLQWGHAIYASVKSMSLPDRIRVKLSSEAAEGISITPVVAREMPLRELVEYMLGVTGKDEARVRELLLRGTLVSGASRFRWSGWEADAESLVELLGTFPDPEPLRPFTPEHCVRVILRGGRQMIEIPREAGLRKPMFRRMTFWDVLLEAAVSGELRYHTYSYKDRADVYHSGLNPAGVDRLRGSANLVTYTSLRDRIQSEAFHTADLYVERIK